MIIAEGCVGGRYVRVSPIQILGGPSANVAPEDPNAPVLDVSPWVPPEALWYEVYCHLGRAPACTSSNFNASGTVDMAWVARLMSAPNVDYDKFLQIALHAQVPGSMQEMSGKSVWLPAADGDRHFIWRTRCPNQPDFYNCAELYLWLMGWTIP